MDKKKRNVKRRIMIIVFILLFVILYTYIYIIPTISDRFRNTYVLEYGTKTRGEVTDYLVIRNEALCLSEITGTVERIVSAGELVKKGTDVVKVGSSTYGNSMRGVVSYYYDGLEGAFSIDEVKELKPDTIDQIKSTLKGEDGKTHELVKECSKGEVQADDVLFKIVDNQQWYLVSWIPKETAVSLSVNSSTKVKFDDSHIIKMKVMALYEQGALTEVVLSSTSYYEDFDRIRIGKATIITEEITGLLLESSSIVTIDDKPGVYVINKNNDKVFRPINILGTFGDTTVVSRNYFYDSDGDYTTTVKIYDTILRE